MSYVDGLVWDVFISYAHIDDAPELWPNGWVQTFKLRLESSIRMHLGLRTGESVSVFIDKGAADKGNHRLSDLLDAAKSSATFVAIGSRTYVARDFTNEELKSFAHGSPDPKCYFVAEVLPLLNGTSYPGQLHDALTKQFYDMPAADGAARRIGPDDPRFNGLINDLGAEVSNQLHRLRAVRSASSSAAVSAGATPAPLEERKIVLLAQTNEDREEIDLAIRARRYLDAEGFAVLPSMDFPQGGPEFEAAFAEDARKSELFVQLLGRQPMRKPRDLPAGYIQRQAELAQEHGLATMQWRPLSLDLAEVTDPAHAKLLSGANVRLESFESFMKAVVARLRAPPKPEAAPSTIAQVYVPFHATDEGFGRIVHDEFTSRGIAVHGPLTDEFVQFANASIANGDSRSVRDYLDKTLIQSDAIVFVYGKEPLWALDQATYYTRKRVERRHSLPRAEVICVGPPADKPQLPIKTPFFRVIDCTQDLQSLRNLINELVA